ncbi:MAG: hypothetical protein HC802_01035 [Caldilineaceae bacterium]|nr:hypothetical protein [Caldilineaceae bacterium]
MLRSQNARYLLTAFALTIAVVIFLLWLTDGPELVFHLGCCGQRRDLYFLRL